MPRYFFHIRDGERFIEDPDGSVLPSLEAARLDGVASARHLLASKLIAGDVLDGQRFEITDGTGTVLAVLMFKDVVRLP